jgi:hypothetical protein
MGAMPLSGGPLRGPTSLYGAVKRFPTASLPVARRFARALPARRLW